MHCLDERSAVRENAELAAYAAQMNIDASIVPRRQTSQRAVE
jgi:hypothetical protein